MKKYITNCIAICIIALVYTFLCEYSDAMAMEKYALNQEKVGDYIFVVKQYKSGHEWKDKVECKKVGDDRFTTIDKNTARCFVTNGKVIYYVKRGKKVNSSSASSYKYKNTIYKYDLKTRKKRKVISGTEYQILGCSGRYLYYGESFEASGTDLYALDMKKNKKQHMTDGAGEIKVLDNKVFVTPACGDLSPVPIYIFNLNGAGKRIIAEGLLLKVNSKKVYYAEVNSKYKFKVFSCNFNGNNKKALTGWKKTIPQKYM